MDIAFFLDFDEAAVMLMDRNCNLLVPLFLGIGATQFINVVLGMLRGCCCFGSVHLGAAIDVPS